jgi:hypothetical protein
MTDVEHWIENEVIYEQLLEVMPAVDGQRRTLADAPEIVGAVRGLIANVG